MAEKKVVTRKRVVGEKLKESKSTTIKKVARLDIKRPEKEPAIEIEKKQVIKKNENKTTKPRIKKLNDNAKKHSRKYRQTIDLIEKDKQYSPEEGIKLVKITSVVNFDAAVEIHVRLNVDPANADQQVRGSLVLPAGTGKEKKVCAIVNSEKEKEAKEAGADTVGGAEIIAKIEKGWLDFAVVVATPDMMPQLGKIGKILGTKGLMPNPKVGTVTNDIGKVVKDLKGGMIEYRVDKSGIIHSVIGRVSFSEVDLQRNYDEFTKTITKVKPSGVKGTYIKSIFLTSSMGPSIKIQ